MNYTQLVSAIRAYTENDFPDVVLASETITSAAQIAQFVQQAEQRIYNTVQFPALRRNVTGYTTPDNKYVTCPDDFLAVHSIGITLPSGGYQFLLNKDVNFIREAYTDPTDTGTPRFYALYGPQYADSKELTFILGPTPDASYLMEMHYFFYPTSIVTAGNTWLGDSFDSVLLYGALVEAYTFMKGEADMIAVYEAKYKEALAMAKRLGDGMERQDSYRSGQARVPVT